MSPDSGIRKISLLAEYGNYPGNFCLWNPESWALKSGIQPKECGTLITIGIRNPVSRIRNPWRGIQEFPYMGRSGWILVEKLSAFQMQTFASFISNSSTSLICLSVSFLSFPPSKRPTVVIYFKYATSFCEKHKR